MLSYNDVFWTSSQNVYSRDWDQYRFWDPLISLQHKIKMYASYMHLLHLFQCINNTK